jgi:hypothetical protein
MKVCRRGEAGPLIRIRGGGNRAKKRGRTGPLKISLLEEESKEKVAIQLATGVALCELPERHKMVRCVIHGSDYNPCRSIDNSVDRNIIHASKHINR